MKHLVVLSILCLAAPLWAQEGENRYSITADTVREDDSNGVTTYEGNAKAEVASLVIEADTISIFHSDGLPSRVEASGAPLRFHRQTAGEELSGTARMVVFEVPELKLTLTDYVITDPSGNSLKGKKASFVLSP